MTFHTAIIIIYNNYRGWCIWDDMTGNGYFTGNISHFTGKFCFIGNGIPAYNPFHRKRGFIVKWHENLTTQLKLCVGSGNKN